MGFAERLRKRRPVPVQPGLRLCREQIFHGRSGHERRASGKEHPGALPRRGRQRPQLGRGHAFLSPELSCRIEPLNTVVGLAVPFVVYADMEGTQPVEDYRIVAKLSVQF